MNTTPTSASDAVRDLSNAVAAQLNSLANSLETVERVYERHLLPDALSPERLRMMIDARRSRAMFFKADMFADPAWDILLVLMESHVKSRRETTTGVSFATGIPLSTVLRKLRVLEDMSLIAREVDPKDARRIFVFLTTDGIDRMTNYLNAPISAFSI